MAFSVVQIPRITIAVLVHVRVVSLLSARSPAAVTGDGCYRM